MQRIGGLLVVWGVFLERRRGRRRVAVAVEVEVVWDQTCQKLTGTSHAVTHSESTVCFPAAPAHTRLLTMSRGTSVHIPRYFRGLSSHDARSIQSLHGAGTGLLYLYLVLYAIVNKNSADASQGKMWSRGLRSGLPGGEMISFCFGASL